MIEPGINVIFSNLAESLAATLADDLRSERTAGDPFEPLRVLVPNKNMAEYLKLSLAERHGVCANVEFPFLEGGLWDVLARLDSIVGATAGNHVRIDSKILTQMVMLVLLRNDSPDLRPFRNFYVDNGEISKLKLWQLCERTATLFLEYEMRRPEMVGGWLKGVPTFADSADRDLVALESAQMLLFNAIFADGGAASTDKGHLTLFQYADTVLDAIDGRGADMFDVHLRVFTPSRLSHRHRELLHRLGRLINVTIYHLNVCAEFWEDASTPAEDRWMRRLSERGVVRQTPVGGGSAEVFEELEPSDELENRLLKELGKPGREMLKLYSDLENDAAFGNTRFVNRWIDTDEASEYADSLLGAVQKSVLNRVNPTSSMISRAGMRSLQICACPSIHREVESVRDSILFNMDENPDLRLSDIAVLVVDMKRYLPVVKSVFDTLDESGYKPIPYSLVDSNATLESHYARGVETLFAVLERNFRRDDVFALFRNPCFQQASGCDAEEVEKWLEAVDSLGVFRGWDELYDAPDLAGLFTWSRGMRRLRIGCVTDGLEEAAGVPPFKGLDPETTGRLGLTLERLRDFRGALAGKRPVDEWKEMIANFLDEFLAPPDDAPQEGGVRKSVMSAFERLTALRDADVELDLDDVRAVIRSETASIPAGRGRYLAGGVVVAALQPMRPIPFKLVYVLGLDEASFPGSPEKDAMDLRLRSRRIGDVDRAESMKYLFLETLMCVRWKLYLSYVSRDVKKDETLFPSSVLRIVSAHAAPLVPEELSVETDDGTLMLPERVVPLTGAEPECFIRPSEDSPFDFGYRYSTADWVLALRESEPAKLADALRNLAESPNAEAAKLAEKALSAFSVESVAASENTEASALAKPVSDELPVKIDLRALSAFLENPLRAALKRLGAMIDDGEDSALTRDEPFSLDALAKHHLFSAVGELYFKGSSRSRKSFEEIVREVYEKELRSSRVPIPLFANIDDIFDEKLENVVSEHRDALESLTPLNGPILLGDAEPASTPSKTLPSLSLTLDDGRQVEISGVLDNLWGTDAGTASAALVCASSKHSKIPKQLFPAFLFWCALRADPKTSSLVSEDFEVRMVFGDKKQSVANICRDCFATAAGLDDPVPERWYLKRLATAFLDAPFDHLPHSLSDDIQVRPAPGVEKIVNIGGRKKHLFEYRFSDIEDSSLESAMKSLLEKAESALDREHSPVMKVLRPVPPKDALEKYHTSLAPIYIAANSGATGK